MYSSAEVGLLPEKFGSSSTGFSISSTAKPFVESKADIKVRQTGRIIQVDSFYTLAIMNNPFTAFALLVTLGTLLAVLATGS